MDRVHRTSSRPWICQDPLSISQFIQSCQQQMQHLTPSKDQCQAIDSLEVTLKQLNHSESPESTESIIEKSNNCSKGGTNKSKGAKATVLASVIKQKEEAVISIRCLRTKVNITKSGKAKSTIRPEYEVEVLSSQLFSDLRSAIRCENEANMSFSNKQAVVSEKSGFFFIEDTFYNDTSEESVDYSQVIMDWAKTKASGIGDLKSKSLTNVKFSDLTIRLGYPYLYRHLGNCEHLFVFQSVRMWNSLIDHNSYSTYPRVNWTGSKLQEKCAFCSVNAAKWKVKEHPHLASSCVLLCQECQQSFCHLDEEAGASARIEAYLDKSILFS